MPLPRRKKWWEKLAEHQHDHFYQEAEDIQGSVPRDYRMIYSLIIEHRLMKHVLILQRYVKKRGLERWLLEQNPDNRDWKNRFLVHVKPIDTTGASKNQGGPDCTIF